MADKKTVVVKKAEPTKEVELEEETKTSPVEEVKVKTKSGTFSEKQANAAASMALKTAIEANSEMALREAEKTYALEKQRHMLTRCKNDRVVTRTISKLYAPYLGKVYTFIYNGIPVTLYCDGKPREYPEFVAKHIDAKLQKISESNTYKEIIEERLD
jgi:hypothetical protein